MLRCASQVMVPASIFSGQLPADKGLRSMPQSAESFPWMKGYNYFQDCLPEGGSALLRGRSRAWPRILMI